ncbi:hypothetical protein BN1051_00675 [Arthrobacter saudimassiliensis]|uniref:Uncharacterized protein n=1 Tax=Arthrobacter saudimassiliensis TaxID=1461584 RepID=A0A078MIZ7_9MICC|nr:hypothetical protein BN1051_00675 [Arthrobacter saudimassiliensis]
MAGKSPRGSGAKKTGRTILEKRAEKRARAETSEIIKPRKNQR